MKYIKTILVASILIGLSPLSHCGETPSFHSAPFTRKIEQYINPLCDYTITKVRVQKEKGGTGYLTLMVASEKPVLTNEESKYKYLMISALAVGKVLNDQPTILVESVAISDVQPDGAGKGFIINAIFLKKLQAKVYNGDIKPEKAISALIGQIEEFPTLAPE